MKDNDIIATEDLPTSGALTYWRLEGALDVQALAFEWKVAGLPEKALPETPAPSTALARAVRELAGRRTIIRSLPRASGQTGHAVVNEDDEGGELSYDVALKVTLDAAGRPCFDPPNHGKANAVREAYDRHLGECSSEDVGTWLVKLVRKLDGLALRDTGGFYYVPPDKLAEWDKIVECVGSVARHRVFKIPAMKSADAVAAILDAIEQEAAREAEAMEAELAEDAATLGERAIATRYKRVEAVESKVGRYEALLGASLDTLRTRLDALRAGLAVAAMKSDAAATAFGGEAA